MGRELYNFTQHKEDVVWEVDRSNCTNCTSLSLIMSLLPCDKCHMCH